MGLCPSKRSSSDAVDDAKNHQSQQSSSDAVAKKENVTVFSQRGSLIYFDADYTEDDLKAMEQEFRGTAFFDAMEHGHSSDDEQEEVLRYAPAACANPYPRASCMFEVPSSMLSDHEEIMEPRVSVFTRKLSEPNLNLQGYPGDLTTQELEACQEFRRLLKNKDAAYSNMVNAWSPVEEEAYAVCRFMRARNFNVDLVLAMMEESIAKWNEAAQDDFYPTVESALGCPASAIFTQYPGVYSGVAKNGTVVVYYTFGDMTVEGIECLTELDRLGRYFWHALTYDFTREVARLQADDPAAFIRCEQTAVVNLKNLTSSQVSRKAIDALKAMSEPTSCFPEMLNKVMVLNAPGFFSFVWSMVKRFLDPRTAAKIEIYSDEEKGHSRLKELVDAQYVPADLGGKAQPFKELGLKQYCAEGHCQLDKLLTIKRGTWEKWEFILAEKERANVIVYSRSSAGADFVIHKGSSETKTLVKGETGLYSNEIASNLEGPGTFKIECKSRSTESHDYFLLIVDVSSQ